MPLTPTQLADVDAITTAINDNLQAIQLSRTDLDSFRRNAATTSIPAPFVEDIIDSNKAKCRAAAAALIVLLDAV